MDVRVAASMVAATQGEKPHVNQAVSIRRLPLGGGCRAAAAGSPGPRDTGICHANRTAMHGLPYRRLWTATDAVGAGLQDRRLHPIRRRWVAVLCAPVGN